MGKKWQLQVFENGAWRPYGTATTEFAKLYAMCKKMAENGQKARIIKVA